MKKTNKRIGTIAIFLRDFGQNGAPAKWRPIHPECKWYSYSTTNKSIVLYDDEIRNLRIIDSGRRWRDRALFVSSCAIISINPVVPQQWRYQCPRKMAYGHSGRQIIRRKLRALSTTTFTANSHSVRRIFFVNSENCNESNLRETDSIGALARWKTRIFQIRYPTIDQTESSRSFIESWITELFLSLYLYLKIILFLYLL